MDGIDGVDFDPPHIPAIADHHANFQLATRITFTANVPQQGNAVNEDGKPGVEVIQGTVGILVTGRLGFASIMALADPQQSEITVNQLNEAETVTFEVDAPLEQDPPPEQA